MTSSDVTLTFELNELMILRNALIETLKYLDDFDCHARTGFHMHEIEQFLSSIQEEIATIKEIS